jgi:hypothetical protein
MRRDYTVACQEQHLAYEGHGHAYFTTTTMPRYFDSVRPGMDNSEGEQRSHTAGSSKALRLPKRKARRV